MKNIEEIKNEVAVKHGFDEWNIYDFNRANGSNIDLMVTEVATEYAKQCCDEQIRECCNNACVKQESEYIDSLTGYAIVSRINEDSILNTPNVAITK